MLSDDEFLGGSAAGGGALLNDDEFLGGAPAAEAKPKDGGSFIPEVGKAVAAGAVSTVASEIKGAAGQNSAMLQSRIDDAKARMRAMDLIDAGKPVPADFGDELLGTQGEVYLNASPEERKGLRESQQRVIATAADPYTGEAAPSPGPTGDFKGLIEPGNIDLAKRPIVKNDDGTISTVRSMSYENDAGQEVLIPTVSEEGKVLSNQEAIKYWGEKGKFLGKFDNPDDATAYALALHEAQDKFYNRPETGLADAPLFKAGAATQKWSDEQFKAAKDYEGTWTRAISEGLGSTVPFLLSRGGTGLVLGSAASSGQQIDDAIAHGATKEQILEAVKLGGLPGLTEQLPIETLFERIPLPLYGKMASAIGKVLAQAAAEGGQEMLQQVAQNLIASYVYNPDQDISEGVLQAGAIGAIVGAGMKVVEPHTYKNEGAGAQGAPLKGPNVPQGAASADTLFGQESAGEPPPSSADTAAGGAPPPSAATDIDRPNSPRLTAEDRASPLPNNLIDDGKKIFEEALAGGRKQPTTAEDVAPLDGQIITPAQQRDAEKRVADIAGEFGQPASQRGRPALEHTIDGSVTAAEGPSASAATPARALSDREFIDGISAIDDAAHFAATSPQNDLAEPTQAMKEAGNYAKGHTTVGGLDVSIENPQGSTRSGVDPNGKPWTQEMQSHYGYIKGTVGKDKDHIDVFIKPGTPPEMADAAPVFVVDQVDPKSGKLDEHKVMMGFATQAEADAGYHANYQKGWKGAGAITPTTLGEFKGWLANGDTTKAFGSQQRVLDGEISTPADQMRDLIDEEVRDSLADGYMDQTGDQSAVNAAISNVRSEIANGETHAPNGAPWAEVLSRLEQRQTGGKTAPKAINIKQRAAPAPTDIIQFLARSGGIQDFKGELRAIDAHKVFVPGAGKLMREKGMPLDRAREAAAQEGFFDAKYGDRDTASEKSTVADLLDLIAETRRGNRQYASGEQGTAAAPEKVDRQQEEVEAAAKDYGLTLDEDLTSKILDRMANGMAADEAIVDILERETVDTEDDTHDFKGQGEPSLDDIPFDIKAPLDARAAGEDREGPQDQGRDRKEPVEGAAREAAPQREQSGSAEQDADRQEGVKPSAELVRQNGINAYRNMSMTPERRADQDIRAFEEHMAELRKELSARAETPEQRAILDDDLARYREGYVTRQNMVWSAKSRTASPMVTGPARFPVDRNRKAMDAEARRVTEFLDWQAKAQASIRKKLAHARTEEQSQSDEWVSLKRDLDFNIRVIGEVDSGKNKSADRRTFTDGIKRRIEVRADRGEVTLAKQALAYVRAEQEKFSKPIFSENNSVWQIAEREEKAPEAKPTGIETVAEYQGATVVDNRDAERVQIIFDDRPSREIAEELKKSGWRWSPSSNAWQRQNTANARYSATSVLKRHFEKAETAPAQAEEPGAEGKPQTVIPGAEKISQAEQAQRGADERLKPKAPQKDAGELFDTQARSERQDELFKLTPTDTFRTQAQDVGKRLRAELDRLGLKDIGLRISENLGLMVEGKMHAADGSYFRKLISISLDADNPDSVLDHEAIHALRDVGAFTKDEWAILERKSRKEWVDRYEIADTYGQFPEWVHVEEGVAHAYADWRAGRSMDGIIAKAFKKIRGIIQAIGRAFGKDFRSAEDVFAQVASGEVGNRSGDADANPVGAGGQPLFQSAWHGTPHEFDQFSLDKIGTGEGNQSFGWGLYFAGKKEIAEHYRKGLSYNQIVRDFREALPDDGDFSDVLDLVGSGHFTPYQDRVLKALDADDWLGFDYPSQAISAAYRHLDDHDPSQGLRDAIASSGKLFKVDLPEDSELMVWDKPLSEQPDAVKTAIRSMSSPKTGLFSSAIKKFRSERLDDIFAGKDWDTITAQEFYGALKLALGSDKAASESLRAADIPGHRYLDGQSRAAGDGTFNYVIYDDTRVNVEERFKLRSEPKTAEDRQKTMQGMIARGQPLDRALRLPFQLLGGVDAKGRWKPGLYVTDKAAKIITTAKIDPEGRFGWLAGPVEAARAGLVDRYGLSPEYIERDRQRHMDERAITMRGAEVLKTLADQNVGPNEARVLQAILTGEAVTDKDMSQLAEPIRQAIDELGQEAVALGLVSAESFERNRGTYLHRVYSKHEAEQNNLQKLVSQIMGSKRKKILGDTLKGRGLFWEVDAARLNGGNVAKGEKYRVLDKVSAAEDGGKVTSRVYLPSDQDLPSKYAGKEWRDNGVWEARQIGKGKVTLWRDYSQAERSKMGEILDARYTIGKTYIHMAHDLAVGRFYKDIAENEDWATASEPAAKWVEADQRSRLVNDRETAWVKVPDTTISNTGGKKRWGALSGKWVRSEIWRDLNEIDIMNRPSTWRMLLSQWKLNKTARSPVTHMNNVMSNLMLMDMNDVRMQDLQAGLRSFIKKDQHWKDANEHGVFGADMMTQEIRDNVLKPILEEMEKQGQDGVQNSFLARAGILGKFADRLWSLAKTADRKMIDLYRIEDDVFRLASYRAGVARGESAEHAALAAREQFFDYDIRAPWVNAARNSLFPFISYTYRAVPLIARAMATRPWKIAKYAMVAYALNALAYAWDDDADEDKERASLRDEEQGNTWLQTPRMMRMPWRNKDGLPVFLDVRRWIPTGDIFDTNQGSSALPIPAPLQFGGPLMLAFELALNKSGFTGDPITNDLTDTWFDKSSKVGDYLWKSWLPSAAWVPNSWYWTKIENAAKGATDAKGRPYSLPEAVSSSFGVKLKPQDVETGIFWQYKDMKDVEQALRAEARTLARQRDRGLISQKAFDSGMQALLDKRDVLVEHVKELQRATRKK
ncbi:hypothetical protein NL532_23975 [Mesorhizobium sp. C120A]|uniref:hypothetical protein n=1 Tax=unclassified Mesorhizobium TaxID=325217 RepID=UPI001FD8963B|nr:MULTISPECIES: hypothetical protein [unclassified Mesorhizobium]WJI48224.1 hypothetical protein NL532_23975 [Mesorhizobium sp. C120A]